MALADLATLVNLARSAPTAARLISQYQAAAAGDPRALDYLKREGLLETVDLIKPGAGETARQVRDHLRDAMGILRGELNTPGTIDADYRVLDEDNEPGAPPWWGFLRRLLRQDHGAHIILGPVGSGKTTLAKRLAARYADMHGYQIEAVNMYADDVPAGAVTIGMDTLVKRMKRLTRYLAQYTTEDEDDEGQDDETWQETYIEEEPEPGPVSLPPTRRVIIIDEAILAMSSNVNNPGRKSSLQALAQCRHLQWVVIYIGQWAGQLPLPLLGQAIVWCKQPNGREALTDRDHPIVRDLWERTGAGFAELRRSPWYQEPWQDPRSWAYCDCQSLKGGPGYSGMVPFRHSED